MRRALTALSVLTLATLTAGCGVFGGQDEADVQIYTARHYDLETAFDAFTEDTGITVEFISGDDAEMRQRLKAEGADSPADIFMTVDAGNLWAADEEGLLEPLDSTTLDEAIPAEYRAADGTWFGLALRGRTLAYNPDKVDPGEFDAVNSYAGLGDPKWDGRICMRDATSTYTQSLVAALLETYGEDATRDMVQSWLDNDVDLVSNDVLQIEAIAAGTCEVGIINHYYLARELEENPDLNVALYWASQDGEGVQMNLSGAGVVATSDNQPDAQKLLEWLATDGQEAFIAGNHELPANPSVPVDDIVASFGTFTPMALSAEAYGARNGEAVELLDELGYK